MYLYIFTYICIVIAGYYTYLYAQLWSAQIWSNRFQHNPLSRYILYIFVLYRCDYMFISIMIRETGMYYRNNLLQYGGSKDKLMMLSDVGSKPQHPPAKLDPAYYLSSRGIIK